MAHEQTVPFVADVAASRAFPDFVDHFTADTTVCRVEAQDDAAPVASGDGQAGLVTAIPIIVVVGDIVGVGFEPGCDLTARHFFGVKPCRTSCTHMP